jgi:Na+-transporting NADH:ubiquinone oxidoreductase subunit NqrC
METNVLISIIVLCLLSGIMVFAYMMHNSAIYPYIMDESDEDEKIMHTFLIIMAVSLITLLIITGIMLYEYCKVVF